MAQASFIGVFTPTNLGHFVETQKSDIRVDSGGTGDVALMNTVSGKKLGREGWQSLGRKRHATLSVRFRDRRYA